MNFSYQNYYDHWESQKKQSIYLNEFDMFIGNLKDVKPPEKYVDIWTDINLPIQELKANNHGMLGKRRQNCLQTLSKRAYYLTRMAEFIGAKNIVEVGTAQGWQFYTFAEHLKGTGGHVWSCDIKDVRNQKYINRYDNATFCLGDSSKLKLALGEEKIDMFYIDGAHDKGSVLTDVLNLRDNQSEAPIWVFDDFDLRFGCYQDIAYLCSKNANHKVYDIGEVASGNPSHQVLLVGKL